MNRKYYIEEVDTGISIKYYATCSDGRSVGPYADYRDARECISIMRKDATNFVTTEARASRKNS